MLGHSQIVLTARYQHVLADRKSVAAGRIEAAVFDKRRRLKQAGRPLTAPSGMEDRSRVTTDGIKALVRAAFSGRPRQVSNLRPAA